MKPSDPEALGLQKQINDLLGLDAQLRDLMKQFSIAASGPAVDPQKSSLKTWSPDEIASQAVKFINQPDILRKKYQKAGWLNAERSRDLDNLNALILNNN